MESESESDFSLEQFETTTCVTCQDVQLLAGDVAIRTIEDDLKHLNVGVRAELKLINKRRSLRLSVVGTATLT